MNDIKQTDNQIPPNIKNEDARLKIGKILEKIKVLEEEKKGYAKPLQEGTQSHIDKLHEDIAEIANSPESKKEDATKEAPQTAKVVAKTSVTDDTKAMLDEQKDHPALKGMNDAEKLKFIAEQAQNTTSTGEKANEAHANNSYLAAVDSFGDKLVQKAIDEHHGHDEMVKIGKEASVKLHQF